MANLDLARLRYFRAVVESGSLSGAARVLGVSQPTLTAAVRSLEEDFGTTLFLRTRSGVVPTTSGELLSRYAEQVFALVEKAEQDIRALETEEVGRFVIGCHESLGAYFLPGFMSQWDAPRVELSLMNGTSKDVRDAVIEHAVHFGLVVNPEPHPDLVMMPLFRDAVDFFVKGEAPKDFAEAEARLKAGPLIYAGRIFQAQELLERLSVRGIVPARLLSCGDLELVKSLTLAGIGVGLLPRRVAAYGHAQALSRLHPSMPFFPDVISLVFRGDLHRTRAAIRLKDALISHGKALDADFEGPLARTP